MELSYLKSIFKIFEMYSYAGTLRVKIQVYLKYFKDTGWLQDIKSIKHPYWTPPLQIPLN